MKYMLLIYTDENVWGPGEREACMEESTALCHALSAEGAFVAASPLQPVAAATSVRVRDGKSFVTDGPFAETAEQLGGYFIIDVPDRDAAIRVASRIPGGRRGTVEIRPIHEIASLPNGGQA